MMLVSGQRCFHGFLGFRVKVGARATGLFWPWLPTRHVFFPWNFWSVTGFNGFSDVLVDFSSLGRR